MAAAMEGRPIEVMAREGRQFSDVATVAKVVALLTSVENPHPAYICVDEAVITWEWIARTVVACVASPSECPCPVAHRTATGSPFWHRPDRAASRSGA